MPHVILKMYPGRTIEQKTELSRAITECVSRIAGCEEKSVSVGIEEISPEEWLQKVYWPDILGKTETLVKKPDYNPFVSTEDTARLNRRTGQS
jgi:4-oxalocrotonate tautomerase